MQERRKVTVALLVAGLLLHQRHGCCHTICPGETGPVTICTVDATVAHTVFTASGGIDCITTVVPSDSLLGGCNNDAGQLALVFNHTANGQSGMIQFTLIVIDSTIADTRVTCSDGNEILGEVHIAGPPSAPEVHVIFAEESRQFILQWTSSTRDIIDRYQLNIPDLTGLTCDNPNIDTYTEFSCSDWPTSAFGRRYTFSVSASNCQHQTEQVGPASEITVVLQVPSVAILMLTPVYDQSEGNLLRIESWCSTVPSVTLATTSSGFSLVEDPHRYLFTYTDGTAPRTQIVESESCVGGICRDFFTASRSTTAGYQVSVAVENAVGVGEPSLLQTISISNNLLKVEINETVVCRFLGGFTGTAECQIEYSTWEDLSGSVVDTGSSTSGDNVTVTLTATLERNTTYYYLVTATAEGVSVRVQGSFETGRIQGSISQMKTNIGVIIGGAVGGGAVLVLVLCAFCVIVCCCWKPCHRSDETGYTVSGQLQRRNSPKGVPNIVYTSFQGDYSQLQHDKPPPVPPIIIEPSQLQNLKAYTEEPRSPRASLMVEAYTKEPRSPRASLLVQVYSEEPHSPRASLMVEAYTEEPRSPRASLLVEAYTEEPHSPRTSLLVEQPMRLRSGSAV